MNLLENQKLVGLALGILLVLVMMPCTVLAVPQEINYQGYLTDAEGNPLNDSVAMTFSIWDAPSAGTQLWSENHEPVMLTEGVFNVVLGSSVPITAAMLDGERYLGITVGIDAEMVPRLCMTAAPYAMKAADADALEGLGSAEFARSSHGQSWTEITSIPARFADGDDDTGGITEEVDPTVPASVKERSCILGRIF
ncbi:MAG TPA: hypothetical protein ENN79_16385 [Desulfobacteraceae bacterium]|nr:hypothetical protein [Desulfobacteraceae bacterium]